MKNVNPLLILAAVVLAFRLTGGIAAAQSFQGFGNIDPQQIQQQMQVRVLEYFRDQLKVTNEEEWKIIEGRLTKVVQTGMESIFSGMGFGGMAMGGMGAARLGAGRNPGGGRGLAGLFQPGPEMEVIQKAIEAGAPSSQIQASLAKYREARQKKKAEIAKAQEELRQVLSLRQEATLVLIGVLD